mmetsp:Transcript_14152/g.40336  ORF Transcript_14152/g.40336 Transcript_14152/m.40336 type:complete len:219 (-) Transcript_14152:213-869(-)
MGSNVTYRSRKSDMALLNLASSNGARLYVPANPMYGFSLPSTVFHWMSGHTSHLTTRDRSSPGLKDSANSSAEVTRLGVPMGSSPCSSFRADSISSENSVLMACTLSALRPPLAAMDCSSTCGGMRAPLRNPGIDTFFDSSAHTFSYAALVALPGACSSTSTADSGSRFSVDACNRVLTKVGVDGTKNAFEVGADADRSASETMRLVIFMVFVCCWCC